jgi:beta-glucosidase
MRRFAFRSSLGLALILVPMYACSTRPDNAGGGNGAIGSGSNNTGIGGGINGTGSTGTIGSGSTGTGVGGSGNTGNGSGVGGGPPLVENDPSCQAFTQPRASVVTPADPGAQTLVSQISVAERTNMLSGGTRIEPEFWTKDFDATGSPTLGLQDMSMRDGPRGLKHVLSTNKYATVFAVGEAIAASWDQDLAYRVGQVIGEEAYAFKYDVYLGPSMDVLRHPQWGRAQEAFGEDPILSGRIAAAQVRGVQDKGVIACPKHFTTYSTEANRGDPNASVEVNMLADQRTLWENYLRNFQIVVEESDPGCIMAAYVSVNGASMTQNKPLLTGVLRDEWKWDGFVVSDWWATEKNQATQSLDAGLDLEMPDDTAYNALGAANEARITESAARIVSVRRKFKHDTDAYKGRAANPSIYEQQSHKDVARETAEKGAVLLKNDGILPLAAGASIVVLGPDARRPHAVTDQRGNPSGLGDRGSSGASPAYAVSVFDGLKNHPSAANVSVTTSENAADAATADVAIIPITMDWEDEGEQYNEGKDRVNMTLAGPHPRYWQKGIAIPTTNDSPVPDSAHLPETFIADAVAANPNVVVLLMVGSAIIMESWHGSVKGIVQTFYPGQEGGNAIANLLFGQVNFSGKLPFTIATNPAHYPTFGNDGTSLTVDYLHGYRRLEAQGNVPRFYFGHGLSYTTYTYGDVKVLCTEGITTTGRLGVEIPVTNSGTKAGDEVVQLYIKSPGADHKQLKAFSRVHIEPGATATVQLAVPAKDIAYRGASGWVVDPGTYEVFVGPSSDPAQLKAASFTIN